MAFIEVDKTIFWESWEPDFKHFYNNASWSFLSRSFTDDNLLFLSV